MKRFPLPTFWTVLFLSLLFIGCPGKESGAGNTDDGSASAPETTAGSVAADAGGGPAAPKGTGGPGPVNSIPFSGDKEKIRKKMEMITGAQERLDTASGAEGALAFKGGRFGGFPVVDWTFLFHQGQMMHAQINYSDEAAGVTADSVYAYLTNLLSKQYGEPIADSRKRVSKELSAYSEGGQQFIATVGKALPSNPPSAEFRLWTAADDAGYVITLNKVQWNTAGGPTFVHLAFYDRALTEAHLGGK